MLTLIYWTNFVSSDSDSWLKCLIMAKHQNGILLFVQAGSIFISAEDATKWCLFVCIYVLFLIHGVTLLLLLVTFVCWISDLTLLKVTVCLHNELPVLSRLWGHCCSSDRSTNLPKFLWKRPNVDEVHKTSQTFLTNCDCCVVERE